MFIDSPLFAKMSILMQSILSLLVAVAFLGTIAALLFTVKNDIPAGVREVLLVLVGVLAGAFKNTYGFWLGTSAGSQRKDAVAASVASTLASKTP